MLPIYSVGDLDTARADLEDRGWELELGAAGTPEGPACILRSPGGVAVALLRVDRPDAMEAAYADGSNSHRVS